MPAIQRSASSSLLELSRASSEIWCWRSSQAEPKASGLSEPSPSLIWLTALVL